jgi:hypothetical protein
MPVVDFEAVAEELESSEHLRVMSALVRSSLVSGADNKPAMLFLTENALFFGGSDAMGGIFHRIPLRSVISCGRKGKLVWECVEVRHMELEGERTVYLCPFKGSPSMPKKDDESMADLLSRLQGR